MLPRHVAASADEIFHNAKVQEWMIREGVVNDLVCVSPWDANTGEYNKKFDFLHSSHSIRPQFNPSGELGWKPSLADEEDENAFVGAMESSDFRDGINFAHERLYAVAKIDFEVFHNEEALNAAYDDALSRSGVELAERVPFTDTQLDKTHGVRCFIMYQNLNRSREWIPSSVRVRIPVAHLRPFASVTNLTGNDPYPPLRPQFDLAVRDIVYKLVVRTPKTTSSTTTTTVSMDEEEEEAEVDKPDDTIDDGKPIIRRRLDKRLFIVVKLEFDEEEIAVTKENAHGIKNVHIVPVNELDYDRGRAIMNALNPPDPHSNFDVGMVELQRVITEMSSFKKIEKISPDKLCAFRNVDNCIPIPYQLDNPMQSTEKTTENEDGVEEFHSINSHCVMIGTNPPIYASFCRIFQCPHIAFSKSTIQPAVCSVHKEWTPPPLSRYITVPPTVAPPPTGSSSSSSSSSSSEAVPPVFVPEPRPIEYRRRFRPCDVIRCTGKVPSEFSLGIAARCKDHGWGRCCYPQCKEDAVVAKRKITAFCVAHSQFLHEEMRRVLPVAFA